MKKFQLIYVLMGLSFLMTCSSLFGQAESSVSCQLSGRILSADAQPLPGATIRLTHSTDTLKTYQAITREDGCFQMGTVTGKYLLNVTYIGFKPHQAYVDIKEKQQQLPDIFLAESKNQLSAVTVTARTVTYNSEGYIANIAQNAQLKKLTLDRILSFLPGMYAGREKINVYMKQVSSVYINDRVVQMSGKDMMDYLRSYEGKNIQKIEVTVNNGVEHAATGMGAASIRITTAKIVEGGLFSASAEANYSGTSKQYGNPFANFMWRKGKVSLNLNTSVKTYIKTESRQYTETEYLSSGLRNITHGNGCNRLPRYTPVRFGFGFDLDDKNLFTLYGDFQSRLSDNRRETTTREEQVGEELSSLISRWYDKDSYESVSANAQYLRKLNNGRFTVTANWGTSETHNWQEQASVQTNNVSHSGQIQGNGRSRSYSFSADFNQRYKDGKERLKLGARFSYWKNRSDTDARRYVDEVAEEFGTYMDIYRYREHNYALYASYDKNWNKLNVQLGLRLEHLRIAPVSELNPERNHKCHYTNLFPNLMLNYTLNAEKGHNVNISYTRTMSSPSMADLNPRIVWENEYTYHTGNPYLEPTFGHVADLRFNLFNGYVLGVQFTDSKLRQSIYTRQEDSEILEISPQNLGKGQDLGIYLGANIMSVKNLMANFNFTYRFIKQSLQNQSVKSSSYALLGDINYNFPKGYSLSTMVSCNFMGKGLQESMSDWYNIDIHLNKALGQNWTVGLSYSYTTDMDKKVNMPDVKQTVWNNNTRYHVAFRVSYSLRWGEWFKVRHAEGGNALGRDGVE